MTRSGVALLGLLALSAGAQAASKPQKEAQWTQEPSSFLGINFNSNIVNDLPSCAPGVIGFQQKALCYEKPFQGLYGIEGKPQIGLSYNYSLHAKVRDGGVEYFYLTANVNDFEKLAQLFITKYGEPSKRTSEIIKTKAGASFTNERLSWSGRNTTILVEKYAGDINTSAASLTNRALEQKSANERNQKLSEGASKL
ncbi:hypothetical protein [Pseudomonas sp. E102]|uniref:hypothetical protein n=1 Tax=Pseudomonas sp. E102 TaxID=181579 RepID=UPI0040458CB7